MNRSAFYGLYCSIASLPKSGVMLLALLALAGCQTFRAAAPSEPPLQLSISVAKNLYQPEEALEMTVVLANAGQEACTLPPLDGASLKFYFGKVDAPEQMERLPAMPTVPQPAEASQLAPGQSIQRKFLFTRLTHYVGPMKVQAHYNPNRPGVKLQSQLFSNVARYDVRGAKFCRRDPEGFLTKEEAVRLATAAAGAPVAGSQAIIAEDANAGFLVWWVNLQLGEGSAARTAAYFVDPYRGRVRAQAKPFDPAKALDQRFKRPEHLPPLSANLMASQAPVAKSAAAPAEAQANAPEKTAQTPAAPAPSPAASNVQSPVKPAK